MNFDQKAREDYKESPKSAVFWWVVASYAYYVRDISLLSDAVFDKLSVAILDKKIYHSMLSHLISDEDLRAGSGYAIPHDQYPLFIKHYAEIFIKQLGEK